MLAVLHAALASPFIFEHVTLAPGTPAALKTVIIRHTETNESVQIAHGSGGKTLRLTLLSNVTGKLRDVLVPLTDAVAIRETADGIHYAGSILAPFANRVANGSYNFYGTRHYLPRNECLKGVRCDALHGFLFNRSLEVVNMGQVNANGEASAYVTLGYKFDGKSTPGWPFKADLNVTYTLVAGGLFKTPTFLRVAVRVVNTSPDMSLPWTHSWHPYFKVSDVSKARVKFDPICSWRHLSVPPGGPRGGSLIPTGKTEPWTTFDGKTPLGGTASKPTYMDDEFKATNCKHPSYPPGLHPITNVNIYDENEVITFTSPVWQHRESNPAWQIFTGAKEGWGWDAVVLEPMSGLADAFNNGDSLTVLEAGEAFENMFEVRTFEP